MSGAEPTAEEARGAPPEGPLDPEIAERIRHLTMDARRAAEGLLSGKHRSRHRGASVVFVEHREYRPGDDPRLLDWRVYARSDRHAIKRFEQEAQLRATLVLDRSGSMAYGEGAEHKARYAATLLAALATILVHQGDAAGLAVLDRALRAELPPRASAAHLSAIFEQLALGPERGAGTDLRAALAELADRSPRRGLVVVASDLLDDLEGALGPLAHLVARGHEAWVLHVLHRDELALPFEEPARFLGLEGEEPLVADPARLRESYMEELRLFLAEAETTATRAGARYRLCPTDSAVEEVLADLVRTRRRRGWS